MPTQTQNARDILVQHYEEEIANAKRNHAAKMADLERKLEEAKHSDPNAPIKYCPVCRQMEEPIWACDC